MQSRSKEVRESLQRCMPWNDGCGSRYYAARASLGADQKTLSRGRYWKRDQVAVGSDLTPSRERSRGTAQAAGRSCRSDNHCRLQVMA